MSKQAHPEHQPIGPEGFCPCGEPQRTRRLSRRRALTGLAAGAAGGALGGLLTRAGRTGRTRAAEAEGRALWVNRFEYGSAGDIARIMERAAEANFNVVYFQVRGAADALYRSAIEPCAVGLCGRLGGEPAYDPLEVAVAEGSDRGLEVHAWLNALTGWGSGTEEVCALLTPSPPGSPDHILIEHPDWAMVGQDGRPQPCPNEDEYVYLAPIHDGVREQLARVAADIAKRYGVRGVHLDRIRYPGRTWGYDEASLAAFGRDPREERAAWADFRRELVDRTVRETYDAITAIDPTLTLSAAVWLVYEDRWDWGTNSLGYDEYLQDPRAWAKGGYLDVAAPMTYEPIQAERCARADWTCLMDDHVSAIQDELDRHVYIGINARHGANEVLRAIDLGRERGVTGFAIYSYRQVENGELWDRLARGPFKEPARVPPQPWKQRGVPEGDGTGGPEASPVVETAG